MALATLPSRRHRSSGIKVLSRCLVMVPPIECDLGYRFLRRTVNPNPNPDPDPNPNPSPNPDPNPNPNPIPNPVQELTVQELT